MNKNLLYQYTSASAFVGMINGGKTMASTHDSKDIEKSLLFWASSVYTMNDPSEMFYGYDKVKGMLERADIKKYLTTFYKQIVITDYTEEQKKKFFIDHFFNVEKTPFAISFSHSKDTNFEDDLGEDLFMWSMYGDSGKGVRLGFDENVIAYNNGGKPKVSALPVCYDDTMIEGFCYPILQRSVLDSYNCLESIKDPEKIIWEKVSIIASLYTLFCSLIKNHKYIKENEWRIVSHSRDASLVDVKIRNRGALIVPYIEMFVPIKYLKEIIIGPCCDFDLQKRNIELMLKSYSIDIETIRIKRSEIPYRNI